MKPSSLSPRLRSRSLLLIVSNPVGRGLLAALPLIVVVDLSDHPCMGAGVFRFKRVAPSELQATLARGFRQRLDAAVVTVARAVERDLLDAGSQRALGDHLADARCGIGIL